MRVSPNYGTCEQCGEATTLSAICDDCADATHWIVNRECKNRQLGVRFSIPEVHATHDAALQRVDELQRDILKDGGRWVGRSKTLRTQQFDYLITIRSERR